MERGIRSGATIIAIEEMGHGAGEALVIVRVADHQSIMRRMQQFRRPIEPRGDDRQAASKRLEYDQ